MHEDELDEVDIEHIRIESLNICTDLIAAVAAARADQANWHTLVKDIAALHEPMSFALVAVVLLSNLDAPIDELADAGRPLPAACG